MGKTHEFDRFVMVCLSFILNLLGSHHFFRRLLQEPSDQPLSLSPGLFIRLIYLLEEKSDVCTISSVSDSNAFVCK